MTQLNTPLEVDVITGIEQSPAHEIAPEGSDGTWRILLGNLLDPTTFEIPYITVTHKWYTANKPIVGNYIGRIVGQYILLDKSDINKYDEEGDAVKEEPVKVRNYIHEFRIRPVTRYLLTEYKENKKDRSGSSGIVGEYASIDSAERIGHALCKANFDSTFTTYSEEGNKPKECSLYAIVEMPNYDFKSIVHFEPTYAEALKTKAKLEEWHNLTFRIFNG